MSSFLSGALGLLLSTNGPAVVSNVVERVTGEKIEIVNPADPVEKEYQRILQLDDSTQEEVDRWLKDNEGFSKQGAGFNGAALSARVQQRLEPVKKAYDEFIKKHPDHARIRVAYGSFLSDINEEEEAQKQWEKGLELDPKNPAAWNNLANLYGHNGNVKKAFDYYDKAISLKPDPVYYQNYATTVFMFRKDAGEHFKISEQEVFNRSLMLYEKALEKDPKNFEVATDLAQCFYVITPFRLKEAREAWNHALELARDDVEREGIFIHLARIELKGENFSVARGHLEKVKHDAYKALKSKIEENISKREKTAAETKASIGK